MFLWGIDMAKSTVRHNLTSASRVYSLDMTFYDEQLIRCFGYDDEVSEMNRLREVYGTDSDDYKAYVVQIGDKYFPDLKARVKSIQGNYYIAGICHDKDTIMSSGFSVPAFEKRHYHVYIKCGNQFYVRQFVSDKSSPYCLAVYDDELDQSLLHELCTIKDFPRALHYLWHDPQLGATTENKYVYDESDIFANRDNFVFSGSLEADHSFTPAKIAQSASDCCVKASELGYKGMPISGYLDDLRKANATLAKGYEKIIRDSYERALYEFVNSNPRTLPRLCVFIYDPNGNVGKSYNSEQACLGLGYSKSQIIKASSSRYGGLDELSADHKVLLLNDMSTEYAHQLSEQENNVIQRRGSGCCANCTDIVIASSNADFKTWYSSDSYCKLSANYNSALTRWFVIDCSDKNNLKVSNYANRGDYNSAYELLDRFDAWFEAFKKSVSTYKPAPKCFAAFRAKYPDLAKWFRSQPKKCQDNFIERFENVINGNLLSFDPVLEQSYYGLYPLYVFLTCDKIYDEESEYEAYIQKMVDDYELSIAHADHSEVPSEKVSLDSFVVSSSHTY